MSQSAVVGGSLSVKIVRETRAYVQAVPPILGIQLACVALLGVVMTVLNAVAEWALASQGRVAVTSGDFAFLFMSWQGWTLLVLTFVLLYLYVAFDLGTKVALSARLVRGEPSNLRACLGEGAHSIHKFLCPDGALTVFYIALVGPLLGVGLSVSLTEGLQIPTFISSVIFSTPTYLAAYLVFALVGVVLGLLGIFCIHGVVIDNLSVHEARRQSYALMRKHGLDYFWQIFLFSLRIVLVIGVLLVAAMALAIVVIERLDLILTDHLIRQATVFGCLAVLIILSVSSMLAEPFTIIKMTELYLGYTTEKPVEIPVRNRHALLLMLVFALASVLLCTGVSYVLAEGFDKVFPVQVSTVTIAHRAGGSEAAENTVAGLRRAAELGAWGAEIDIQRTSDDAYVVNHDATFERTTGDARKPSDMTLSQARKLMVDGEPVASYEDMLAAARDTGIVLFVELKGETADHQMADDAVRIARECGMFENCVFISLNYELINYLENSCPEAKTGLLAFASYGNTAALNCDYLALEELAATGDAIDAIHAQGKKALVWTVNDRDSQHHFLTSGADAIITDNVAQAAAITSELAQRDDITRIVDTLLSLV